MGRLGIGMSGVSGILRVLLARAALSDHRQGETGDGRKGKAMTDTPTPRELAEQLRWWGNELKATKRDPLLHKKSIWETLWPAAAALESLEAENARLREALEDAEFVLALSEKPRMRDPDYGKAVEELGDRIGFGALMSSASASWRYRLEEQGECVGGEHVVGPCWSTVIQTLTKIRAALATQKARRPGCVERRASAVYVAESSLESAAGCAGTLPAHAGLEDEMSDDKVTMLATDANNLDAVVRVLGIENSHVTPAEAVEILQDKIDALQTALTDLLKTTPEERQDPAIWLARVDAARSALGAW